MSKKPADNKNNTETWNNTNPMKYTSLRITTLALIVVATGFFSMFSYSGHAHADTTAVIPPRFELFANPGDTLTEKIQVQNSSTAANTYSVLVDNFTAQGDTGGVVLEDPGTGNNSTYSLAKWITVEPSNFTVNAGQSATIAVTIKVPVTGEPGGHYASVLVERGGGSVTGGGASVATEVGSLFLLRVSGDITEKLSVDSFATEQEYSQSGPVTFDLHTTNQGNVHVAPTGKIVITNMFGHKVAEIPLTSANVLPGASRLVKTTWDANSLIGRYTATLVATYGQQNESITAVTTFVVFPLWLLWLILGVILVILLFLTQRKRIKRMINRLTSD